MLIPLLAIRTIRIVCVKKEKNGDYLKQKKNAVKATVLIGFMTEGDSVYHTTFHPVKEIDDILCGFTITDIQRFMFITEKDKEENDLEWCGDCMNLDIDYRIEDGDLIFVEDAAEYCGHDDKYY